MPRGFTLDSVQKGAITGATGTMLAVDILTGALTAATEALKAYISGDMPAKAREQLESLILDGVLTADYFVNISGQMQEARQNNPDVTDVQELIEISLGKGKAPAVN